ncbi:hypothetical protein [Streptomyces sp. NPDC051576]|uniref:hypothetical protein n=1 Tax=Streptomyces sp. NPDC051576 TaxID=3155803 RepID=UPI003435A56C
MNLMRSGLIRRVATLAAVSAAVLACTVSAADATTVGARHEVSAAPVALRAGNFAGRWTMDQSNVQNIALFLNSPDGGGGFTGLAAVGGDRGDINGTITGDNVVFFIHWNFGHTGRYDGHQGSDGRWSGVTTDLNDPSSQATWTARPA